MIEEQITYETKRIDHLGIVAGVCKRIGLINAIDETVPNQKGENRVVSCGEATQAMVLNALGLTGRALYLMPEYMENKPVDLLIREGLKASDFNDDTLGRALDDLQQGGVTEMFATIASDALKAYGIEPEYAHVDSSTISLTGEYESAYAVGMCKTYEAVEVKHGYSRDHRPDLKQVVVNLITSQASALPLWLEVLDGNSNDTKTFQKTIEAYCDQLSEEQTSPYFIMDRAGYSADNVRTWQENDVEWVCGVPATNNVAKAILKSVTVEEMVDRGDGYHTCSFGTWYAGVNQRWVLVHSEKAAKREKATFLKQMVRQQKTIAKQWRHLTKKQFQCSADAQIAQQEFVQHLSHLSWWQLNNGEIVPIQTYKKRGRPAKNATPQTVGWRIIGQLSVAQEEIDTHTQWLGRFIIATNILNDTDNDTNERTLSDASLLASYKEQSSSVERGFRFLKDPMFFADSLFVKSPVRIMSMIMIMGVALLVYSLAERELRLALKEQNETIPHQTGRPTQTVTMRRVAQIFEGVDLLLIRQGTTIISRQIVNLSPLRLKILRLFHPSIQNCYLLNF